MRKSKAQLTTRKQLEKLIASFVELDDATPTPQSVEMLGKAVHAIIEADRAANPIQPSLFGAIDYKARIPAPLYFMGAWIEDRDLQ